MVDDAVMAAKRKGGSGLLWLVAIGIGLVGWCGVRTLGTRQKDARDQDDDEARPSRPSPPTAPASKPNTDPWGAAPAADQPTQPRAAQPNPSQVEQPASTGAVVPRLPLRMSWAEAEQFARARGYTDVRAGSDPTWLWAEGEKCTTPTDCSHHRPRLIFEYQRTHSDEPPTCITVDQGGPFDWKRCCVNSAASILRSSAPQHRRQTDWARAQLNSIAQWAPSRCCSMVPMVTSTWSRLARAANDESAASFLGCQKSVNVPC